jgi:hypothetical protein
MRKDGIQTRKRKPKKQQAVGIAGTAGEKAEEDLTATGKIGRNTVISSSSSSSSSRAVTSNMKCLSYIV